jgi:hypothetical protein
MSLFWEGLHIVMDKDLPPRALVVTVGEDIYHCIEDDPKTLPLTGPIPMMLQIPNIHTEAITPIDLQ